MKIVVVTACTAGIARAYLAAAHLEKVARSLGHEIRVETQGAMGIENGLTERDIREAEITILANDIEIEGRERFNGMKIIQISLQDAIRNPEGIFRKIQG